MEIVLIVEKNIAIFNITYPVIVKSVNIIENILQQQTQNSILLDLLSYFQFLPETDKNAIINTFGFHLIFSFQLTMSQNIKSVLCLCGNDGTGKSTLINIFKQHYPTYAVIQRSTKQQNQSLESLRKEIKQIDLLTYRYAFQNERYDFQPSHFVKMQGRQVQVHWVLLDLDPQTIFKRISNRIEMGIYQSIKCVEYFSYVYLQLAAFYGMTVVDVLDAPKTIATYIVEMIQTGATRQIRFLNVKNMNMKKIMDSALQNLIQKNLTFAKSTKVIKEYLQLEIIQSSWQKLFYLPELNSLLYQHNQINSQLGSQLAARWIALHSSLSCQSNQLFLKYNLGQNEQKISLQSPIFVHYVEGESKKIYQVKSKIAQVEKYFVNRVWIILKSTIYSHTNQHTGEIQSLGKIRAIGSNLFLEMLRRNNLQHAYIAINHQGIIFSRKIQTNSVEVVFKRQFVGTDKHSYFGLNLQPSLVTQNKYKNGIYIRFDWRNPNHVLSKFQNVTINLNPFYYIIQKYVGKEKFFEIFLKKQLIKPIGDKCITEDLIINYTDTKKIKKSVLALYCAFAYYCKQVNLHIVDGCFMFNRDGSVVWSEINPDCMRVKHIQTGNQRVDYDKDIWRTGGSSSKDLILKKWTLFNKLLIEYFLQNRFHETQLLNMPPYHYPLSESATSLLNDNQIAWTKYYSNILLQLSSKTQKVKEVISTIDISDGKPSLVRSSILSQHHSGDSLAVAFNYLKVMPKVVLVDLDAAMGKQRNNRQQIKKLTMNSVNNVYAVGGGIRTIQVLNYYLFELCIPKIIMSSNLDLLQKLPYDVIEQRIIVQLSINQNNEILTHGRTVNTGIKVTEKMVELAKLGVKIVSITFNHKQGHLLGIPRQQFRDIMFQIPGPIRKVIIAGGITSLSDLQMIWGFPKAVPQLGSAIWKNKILLCDIISRVINFNQDGLIPSIICNSSGKVLGQVYLDKEALKKSVQTRQLHRFSRKLNRLIKKGEQSGNTQKIEGLYIDCDNDCLKIVVEDGNKPFCHNLTQSCFDVALPNKIENLEALQKHIQSKKYTGSGYSKKMQQNEHLAACKVLQQSRELIASKDRHVQEGADLIAHLLMYFNAKNIPLSSFMQELNFRANQEKMIKEIKKEQPLIENRPEGVEYIGLMGGKHFGKIDNATLLLFGLRIIRPTNRSLKIQCVVEDQQKYDQYFKGVKLMPIGIKSKDMGVILEKKYVKWCFNYSIMMDNYPKIWKELTQAPISGIKLVILKKKDKEVNPFSWTKQSKGRVITQYPTSMINYLHSLGISEANYSLITVSGGTEGFLQMKQFDYCDAIVQSGKTVEDNNLQVVKIICDTIYGSLYTLQ